MKVTGGRAISQSNSKIGIGIGLKHIDGDALSICLSILVETNSLMHIKVFKRKGRLTVSIFLQANGPFVNLGVPSAAFDVPEG